MIINAYSVYDRKALQYHAPFFAVADGAAVRSFMDLANDSNTTVGRHPGDYVLYRVGSFDDASGIVLPTDNPQHVTDALPLVRAQGNIFDDPHAGVASNAVNPNGKAA